MNVTAFLRPFVIVVLMAASAISSNVAYAGSGKWSGRIYWTEYQFLNSVMKSMNIDGSDLQTTPLPNEFYRSFGTVIDAEGQRAFVLHATVFGAQTTPVDLHSGQPLPASSIDHGQPSGLSIERANHRVYWTDTLGSPCGNALYAYEYEANEIQHLFSGCLKSFSASPVGDPVTGRVYFGWFGNLVSIAADGSDLTTISHVPVEGSLALHPAAAKIYWLEPDGDLWSMNVDGTNETLIAAALHPASQGGALQIDRINERLYWIDFAEHAIKSSNLDGLDIQTLYTGPAEMNLGSIDVVMQEIQPVAGDVTHDGLIDVDDVLAVISAWGPCPGMCVPSCPADIAPDQQGAGEGDCLVNVDDLLMVINNWNPNPT